MSLGIGQPIHDWLRHLPPNVQGALWLVSGAPDCSF